MGRLHVAVGVIIDDRDRVLISRRAEDSHQGGLWEFPGGKVESGESLGDALARELREELDIQIAGSEPLLEVRHDYSDKAVLLDVHLVRSFSGQPRALENQPLAWVTSDGLSDYRFPAANAPIVQAVQALLSGAVTG
jgi:8-oxo-dGTP diphosphatase